MSTPSPNPQNPYAPPVAPVQDVSDSDGPGELADRSSRLGAFLVDALILVVAELPTAVVAFGHLNPAAKTRTEMLMMFKNGGLPYSAVLFCVWAVITILFVRRNGQTIGKRAIGIKVVRSDGSKASLARIFWLRNVVNGLPSFIPIVSLIYWLVDTLMIFGESRRCLHDRIADTIVVKA